MRAKLQLTQVTILTSRSIALIIFSLGFIDLTAWHNTDSFPATRTLLITMAYSTAVCLVLMSLALLAATWQRFYLAGFFSLPVFFITALTFFEACCRADLEVNNHLMMFVKDLTPSPTPMASTTILCFLLMSFSVLPLSVLHRAAFGQCFILMFFLNFLTLAIATIALLGRGFGWIPAFVWLGISMVPLTATALIVMSAGILFYSFRPAIFAFSRLNFFNHMAIAFGFITLLFIGVGSIVLAQIDSVASIMRELHHNPMQVNKAAFEIREEIDRLNRDLKNIAIQPELSKNINILQRKTQAHGHIRIDMEIIGQLDDTFATQLQRMERRLVRWDELMTIAHGYLQNDDVDSYRLMIINESQEEAVALERLADDILKQSRSHVVKLNTFAKDIQRDAKRLILISVAGFLTVSLFVAYLITRQLSNQLHQLRRAMLDIAHKRENVKIPFIDYSQEIGDMARALAVFAANINVGRRMEVRMRQIIEAAPNGIIMINDGGSMEIVNQQAEKLFGYDRLEMLGQPVEQLLPERLAHDHPSYRNDFFANPSPRPMGAGRELFGLRKDGTAFPMEVGLAPIETDEGLKVLASIVDISERKKSAQLLMEHQSDLERSNKELARINKELEAFAYVASHDLKSPLRGIAQLSNWIEEDLSAGEYVIVSSHTRMLRSRIHRMEKLLDDLLIFYRAGKIENSASVIDVKRMVMDLFEIQNNKPGLHLEMSTHLPTFIGLMTPFEQVLRNLLSNAIKHHDRKEGVISVGHVDLNAKFHEFRVCDDGPGIPAQFQDRVFGMFQTLKPRDEVEGSGMGLALIKKIVEHYGGVISVSSIGRGACFIFTWPKHTQGNSTDD